MPDRCRSYPHRGAQLLPGAGGDDLLGGGVSLHIHGTDNARCLISLALLCGHVGRSGIGLHPFMPFTYVEAAANVLTNPQLDPFGRIPEFKYSAVWVGASDAVAAE